MDVSNRTLAVMVSLTLVLVVFAVVLTLGIGDEASAPSGPGSGAASGAQGSAVVPVVTREGGIEIQTSGALEITVETGSQSPSAMISCDLFKSERPVEAGKVVFPKLPLGGCSVLLKGTTSAYDPVYPGDRITCLALDGRTECTGGLVSRHAARVSIESQLPGELLVDGDAFGPLPLYELRMKPGRRALVFRSEGSGDVPWTLVVQPEERIHVFFPSPRVGVEPTAGGEEAATASSG